jgi:hypothetical protein
MDMRPCLPLMLVGLLWAAPVSADPLTIKFEGVLTDVFGNLFSDLSAGDVFEGTAVYTPYPDDPFGRQSGQATVRVGEYLIEADQTFADPNGPWLHHFATASRAGVGLGLAEGFTLLWPMGGVPGEFSLTYLKQGTIQEISGRVTSVPEPASLLLVSPAVVWLLRRRRRADTHI